MLLRLGYKGRRQVILAAGLLVQCGIASVHAQGLDMDASTATPAPPPHAGASPLNAGPATGAPVAIAPVNINPTPAAPPDQTPAAPAQPAPPRIVTLDHPRVVNTAQLQSGDITVTLYGLQGLTGDLAQGLQSFLGDAPVTCQAQDTAGFVCKTVNGTDVALAALANGAAEVAPGAPDAYRTQENEAQAARRGVWANLPPPPLTVQHPVVRDTATLWAANQTFVLDGIDGFQAPYNAQLQSYILASGDTVTCQPQPAADHYVCLMADGTDIAKFALVNGAATVEPDAPDAYRVQQLDAVNNRRGYWATVPPAVLSDQLVLLQADPDYAFVAGDDGVDGITYIGGEPTAVIDGELVFLSLGAAGLGWGYYDHYHHWHGAPDRFRAHLDRFHPGGRGLRGFAGDRREEALRHDEAFRRREDMVRRDPGLRDREAMLHREDPGRGRDAFGRGREDLGHGREGVGPHGEPGRPPGDFAHRDAPGREAMNRPGEQHPGAGPFGRNAGPVGPGARPGPAPGGGFGNRQQFAGPGGAFHPPGPVGGGVHPAPAAPRAAPAAAGKKK
jgi:endonuclease YncB( thermonuclease family)